MSVSILCEFAMLPDVYILLSPQEESVYFSSWGDRCTRQMCTPRGPIMQHKQGIQLRYGGYYDTK